MMEEGKKINGCQKYNYERDTNIPLTSTSSTASEFSASLSASLSHTLLPGTTFLFPLFSFGWNRFTITNNCSSGLSNEITK